MWKIGRFLALAMMVFGTPAAADAADRLAVIASFSILGDLVGNVGGDHVTVRPLVGPNGDAHVFEPSPADAAIVAKADLVVVNSLGLEGWLDRLIEASGYSGPIAVASENAKLISAEPDRREDAAASGEPGVHEGKGAHPHDLYDPHAWQSAMNAVAYAGSIADALCGVDAGNCEDYRANAARYSVELKSLDASIRAGFARIPNDDRKIITSHDAFTYFGDAYGIRFIAPQGVSTEAEASAADVAALIEQIRREGVTALFVENVSDPRLIEQIARETGVVPGGELYSDALSEETGPAPTYLLMMKHNAALMQAAMQRS